MAFDLKAIVCSIKLGEGGFQSSEDEECSKELYDKHSLQALLENASSFSRETKHSHKSINDKFSVDYYISVLTVLINNSPPEWISTFIYGFNHPETSSLCVRCLRTIYKIAKTKAFGHRDQAIYDESDFEGISEKAVLVLTLLQSLFKQVATVGKQRKQLDHWRSLLQVCFFNVILLAEHAESNLWTSSKSVETSQSCLQVLMDQFHCSTVCKLLTLDTKYVLPSIENDSYYSTAVRKSIFGKLLLYWKSNLERSTWRENPLTAASFSWCLKQMVFPHLSDFIELILPPTLLFMDDHMLANKMHGTQCLIHILKNTGAEELRWYDRAEVIFSALKLQLLSTEEGLLPLTHEAILLNLKILVKSPDDLAVLTKYDEIFVTILQAASHENKLALRRIHTAPMHILIEEMGINTVKFTKMLFEIFEEYLEISDAPYERSRINTLLAIKSFIKVAYPRMSAHCETLLKLLIKLLHDVTKKKLALADGVEKELISECKQCIELLKIIDEKCVTETLCSLRQLSFEKECIKILECFLSPADLDAQVTSG